jgi:thymidylate synthase
MDNLDNLWTMLIQDLMQHDDTSSRLGPTKEIMGYQGRLENIWKNVLYNSARKFSMSYACAEMLWYLSGTDDVEFIGHYAPSYVNYTEDGVHAWGSYGKRWATIPHQINLVHDILSLDPNSRQAIMTMYRVEDLIAVHGVGKKDIPCTLTLQFLLRENRLNLIANMRSNDAWLGLPYDIFCFTTLQRILADMLQVKYGEYVHQSGSEHLYQKNWKQVEYTNVLFEECPKQVRLSDWQDQVKRALVLEEQGRNNVFEIFELNKLHPIFRDLVIGTWMKWGGSAEFSNRYYEALRNEK